MGAIVLLLGCASAKNSHAIPTIPRSFRANEVFSTNLRLRAPHHAISSMDRARVGQARPPTFPLDRLESMRNSHLALLGLSLSDTPQLRRNVSGPRLRVPAVQWILSRAFPNSSQDTGDRLRSKHDDSCIACPET